jgi:hypothetical protein
MSRLTSTALSVRRGPSEKKWKRKNMNYIRPEIVLAGSAIAQIQGTSKTGQFTETPQLQHATLAAYEADE